VSDRRTAIAWPTVVLPDVWCARCRDFGDAVVCSMREGRSQASRAYAFAGADANAELQTHGRLGEVALALLLDLDPDRALDWRVRPGAGHDLVSADRFKVDAKTIRPHCHRMIWPYSKNDLYADKAFDVMALLRGPWPVANDGPPPRFDCVGWVGKARFDREHVVATNEPGLHPGSRYMELRDLASGWSLPGMPS
jgi:hypothetical protein